MRIKGIFNQKPFFTGREVRVKVLLNLKISAPTINMYLRGLDLFRQISRRVTYYNQKRKSECRHFCMMVKNCDFKMWRKVVFCDKVRIKLESQSRMFIRRHVEARNIGRSYISR